ncbi:MAG TPA: ABC transporter ATP-binding protein [Firmicutes bacterium]|nr:ABC transporter ATP-binding protein [Bacillota bacterium]
MRRLLSYARPFRPALVACMLLLLLATAGDLSRPYILKVAIDSHINVSHAVPNAAAHAVPHTAVPTVAHTAAGLIHGEASAEQYHIHALIRLALLLLVITAAGFVLNYIQTYLLGITGQKIIFNMRRGLFSHIERLSVSFFDKNPVGRLVTRVTNDMEALNEMYTGVLIYLFKDILLLAGTMAAMAKLDTRLALVSFSVLPVIAVLTYFFRVKARDAYRRVRTRLARINAALAENLAGMKVIQAFNQEERKFGEFNEINRDYYRASMQELMVFSVFRPAIDLVFSLALCLLLWFGGGQVVRGRIQFGVLYAFINYMMQFFQPINDLAEKYNIMQSAMAAAERIFMLLDTKDTEYDREHDLGRRGAFRPRFAGEVEFKNVSFGYNDNEMVLRDVSFHVNPGETVAFVGATGAGKTSIMSLLMRFYEPQKGQILIDGVDIRNIARDVLRSQISVVMQDVFLFSGDVKGNIRLNDSWISDDEIEAAARYVHADGFIRRLKAGYNEPVTERGSTLSAGERQLLSFARAIVRDPAILVLDEATSTIDTETEVLIQDALRRLRSGRTTLVVAHRLSTIRDADKIIVLHKGRVREVGTHRELLAKRGLYYQLYLLQCGRNLPSGVENR